MGKKDKKNSREETIKKLKGLKEAAEKEKEAEARKAEKAAEEAAKEEKKAEEKAEKTAEEKPAAEGSEAAADDTAGIGDKAKAKIDELNDKVMRQMAEF